MRKKVSDLGRERKKKRVLEEVEILKPEEYQDTAVDVKVELIKELIPLGLMHVRDLLEEEVEELAGRRYERAEEAKTYVRHGKNPGSVKLAGQRIRIKVPRVRNRATKREEPLKTLKRIKGKGETDEILLNRVLYGISCRNYEKASEQIPGAIGLSPSSVSKKFIEATSKKLREFQERDLSSYDLTALWIDGKRFAQDMLVVALGVTMEGEKVPLGFVQTGTENEKAISGFLGELISRGMQIDQGLLVIIDGSKGLRSAVKKTFQERALVQRCHWHKRENVVSYLPKGEQDSMRRRLQRAYEKPTYMEAKAGLKDILEELKERNISAARSLEEGLEETLTLHRLGMFELLSRSLKTTNCLESLLSQVERMCGKVCYWKNSSQKHRWLATALLDIEPRLNRISGHKQLPLLRVALQEELGIREVKSVA